nr:SET and MYND domain-containing protein 4-like [Lepeophtheirus salmonis]
MFDPKNLGFFPIYYEKYLHLISQSDVISPSSLEVKLKNLWKLLEPENPFTNIKPLYGVKSDKKSAHHRGIGNSYFYEKDYSNSLLQYSLAVFIASFGSIDFTLALANRSAVFQKLSLFEESLVDIDFCLQCGSYPKEKVFKLYERQAEIYETMILRGNDEKVLKTKLGNVVSSALEYVGLSDLNKEKKANFCNNIKQKLDAKIPDNIESNKKIRNITKPCEDTTNKGLEMQYEEGRGRYMVANRDIQPGETIILETPGSFSLHPKKFGTHCLNCFKIKELNQRSQKYFQKKTFFFQFFN